MPASSLYFIPKRNLLPDLFHLYSEEEQHYVLAPKKISLPETGKLKIFHSFKELVQAWKNDSTNIKNLSIIFPENFSSREKRKLLKFLEQEQKNYFNLSAYVVNTKRYMPEHFLEFHISNIFIHIDCSPNTFDAILDYYEILKETSMETSLGNYDKKGFYSLNANI